MVSKDVQVKLIRSNAHENSDGSIVTFQPIRVVQSDGTEKLMVYKKMDISTRSIKRSKTGEVLLEETLNASFDEDARAKAMRRRSSFLFDGNALATSNAVGDNTEMYRPESTAGSTIIAGLMFYFLNLQLLYSYTFLHFYRRS